MSALLPSLKILYFHSLADSRCPLLHSFPRSPTINRDKPVWASAISSLRRRECGISFVSRRRSRTTSTSVAIVSEDEKEDWNDDEEEEEEGEEVMPLREMTRWLQNKPAGFGDGMKYDTTVEDKLLEELKAHQKVQLEGNRKPREREKHNAGSVKKEDNQKDTEVIKIDHEVRVWNLPKKKNIDRDLGKAFKGFPGIISINPAVNGNKKTRDPICKGFALIGFESDDAAYRFVQKYSKQNLLFGKVQKQIFCDVMNAHDVPNSPETSKSTNSTSPNRHSREEISISSTSDIGVELPNDRNVSLSNNENEANEDQNRKKIARRDKTKPLKSSKAHILGSLAKLKIKDRAVLTCVFSKYGEVPSAASKEI